MKFIVMSATVGKFNFSSTMVGNIDFFSLLTHEKSLLYFIYSKYIRRHILTKVPNKMKFNTYVR